MNPESHLPPESYPGAARFELATWECFENLRLQTVGRLCIIDCGYPVAYPMTYRVDGPDNDPRIVLRTSPGTAIGSYTGLASLEVDDIDLEAGRAWSVIVRGLLRPVTGPHGVDPQPFVTEHRSRWVELPVTAISGRRFVAAPRGSGATGEWRLVPIEDD